MQSEWELLVEADDITKGDSINVESDDGDEVMVYVKHTAELVYLKSESGSILKFYTDNLEEISGTGGYITGKHDDT